MPQRRGFTLVELLVAVAIIVVLMALLAPALDKAMEAALRVKCAAQLRVIHGLSYQYAQENRNAFFVSRFRAVSHGFNAIHPDNNDGNGPLATPGASNRSQAGDQNVNWIEAIATVGLTVGPVKTANGGVTVSSSFQYRDPAPVWNCPSTQKKSTVSTTYTCLDLMYQFFGGHDRWYNTAQGIRESRGPVRLTQSEPHWVLATDRTFQSSPSNHAGEGKTPAGGNQVWVDGSAEWLDFDRLAFITGYNNDALFMWQSDLGPGGLAETMKAKYFK